MKIIIILMSLFSSQALAELNYKSSKRFPVGNHELYDFSSKRAKLKNYKVIDLSASIDIGSNCGQMDVAANLRANMKEFISGDFFKGMGNQIMDAGGLLALCYLSPAACSITKNARLTSGLTSAMDLDACSMIEKYQDQQIAVYERERSQCVRSELKKNGNNTKLALRACGQRNYEHNLMDWAGSGHHVDLNKLIESTAKWAGLSGDDANEAIEVTKAFVGDTVIGKGGVEVEFGARKHLVTPSELIEIDKAQIAEKLESLVEKQLEGDSIAKQELAEVFSQSLPFNVALDVLEKLAYLPSQERVMASQKLAESLASQKGIDKVEKSMQLLLLASRNPNVPDPQKLEAKHLSEQLKNSLEVGLEVKTKQNRNLEKVVYSITKEGQTYQDWDNDDSLMVEKSHYQLKNLKEDYLNCSDPLFCGEAQSVLD